MRQINTKQNINRVFTNVQQGLSLFSQMGKVFLAKYEMGDTVQVACDDIAKGLNAFHCIELHIISDLSTVVVL